MGYYRPTEVKRKFIAGRRDIKIWLNPTSGDYEMWRSGKFVVSFSKDEYKQIWQKLF